MTDYACTGCGWTGTQPDAVSFSWSDWVMEQDGSNIALVPQGECPDCGAEVYNAEGVKALTLAMAAGKLLAVAEELVRLSKQPRPSNRATAAGEGMATRSLVGDAESAIAATRPAEFTRAQLPKIGQRVRVGEDGVLDYPHTPIPAGELGTVTEANDRIVRVKMDTTFETIKDWDNCVEFYLDQDDGLQRFRDGFDPVE